ncbi:NAD(P)-dependent oxidoreductase [Agreia sp. PsM10]|nr:NAD(P)-dependent oxidoreductase [Agreia sp. PsM10]
MFRGMATRFRVEPIVSERPFSAATAALAAGSRCISVNHTAQISNATLWELSLAGVEYISTRSIGTDHLDVGYAQDVGITVENVGYSPDSVADYTLMLILMAIRDTKSVLRRVDARDYRLGEVRGTALRDLTVGVIGTGRIGTAVMHRLQGFGCRVLAYDTRPRAEHDYLPLDELLQQSDLVTLHTPSTPANHHLLHRSRLAQLPDGAFVVNTARGALVDTDALLDELESGRLGGAALDVVENEEGVFYADHQNAPVVRDQLARLQQLPNVVISPHIGFYTERALSDIVENSLINCARFGSRRHHG